ncbi:ABC transporter substrate-binding protein [Actinomadura nitritigenes]|uniref:Extracellular solute-binding protein n=1 Tax=Actinomadura nitritigenes TaxID=134602 RepID=A0ABS3REM5_9ACTN|nr:extracellular solute-binding protein [Actinomadura nitritigenes]MBO2444307.1 extracellular solute-binding protein [Actinomadura nitritigenes]
MMQGKTTRRRWRAAGFAAVAVLAPLALAGCGGSASGGSGGNSVSMAHYFSDSLGSTAFKTIVPLCTKETGHDVKNSPIQHEAFKDSILVQLAGGNPPDLFSYWAGAKTQYLVDQKRMAPLDDVWTKNKLDDVIPQSLSKASADYNGHKYLLPFDYHYVGMFYNPKVMKKAGITTMPKTWDELMAAAAKLKAAGITPFALGSKEQWPAQFWFDYLLLRTAGPDYRQKLMAGQASYTDPQVKTAFSMWKEVFDKGYFNDSPNGIDWQGAADMVAKGQAAMTLNGTWITGYWDGNKIPAVGGYDMFPFPEVTPGVPQAALGPVDGWAMSTAAPNKTAAEDLLKCLSGPEVQKAMAFAEGALAPNKNADLSSQNAVMHKAAKEVQNASTFVFNYDLATPPEMSEPGLNVIQKFVDDPSKLDGDLREAQSAADGVFKKN